MRKEKYYYNKHSLRYEKIERSFLTKALYGLAFLSSTLFFSFLIYILIYNFVDSPKEKKLKNEITKLSQQYELTGAQLKQMTSVLEALRKRDANIYRVIFEKEPIADGVWYGGTGGADIYSKLKNYDNSDLMINVAEQVDKLKRQMTIQSQSYDTLANLIKNKEKMLSSIPSIQPVSNVDLTRVASGYGMRTDPVYKIPKMHYGMDFTAPTGTEIYTTGDGVVEKVSYSKGGYGNRIIVNHGFGYKTLYAHMSRFNVYGGQKVKRGQVIGFVGNTGKSVGPHLHYEVHYRGQKINPVYFYYNDLDDKQYEQMLDISASGGQTLD